jgi:hypothetical protein
MTTNTDNLKEKTMSHHSDKDFPFDESFVNKIREESEKLLIGATGEFPEGKLNKSDDGAIQFMISHTNEKVILDFRTPVKWLGMNPKDAVAMAQSLITHARRCSKEPLLVEL